MFADLLELLPRLGLQWPWLCVLLPLPLALRWLPAPRTSGQQAVRVPNLPQLLPAAQAGLSGRRERHRRLRFAGMLAWCLLVLAAARPQLSMPAEYQMVSVRNLVLVLDVSGSMATEDMHDAQGQSITRLQAMQTAVRDFIEARKDDAIGLIVFGSQAYPFAPLSRQHQVLTERVGELEPAMAGAQTSMGDALGATLKMLASADSGESTGQGKERMVVLLTDGKDTSSTLPPEVALRLAREAHVQVHTIAMGEDREATMNLALLQKMAASTGGTFHRATGDLASLRGIYAEIDRLAPRQVKQLGWSYRQPLYSFPLLGALVVLGLMIYPLRARERADG